VRRAEPRDEKAHEEQVEQHCPALWGEIVLPHPVEEAKEQGRQPLCLPGHPKGAHQQRERNQVQQIVHHRRHDENGAQRLQLARTDPERGEPEEAGPGPSSVEGRRRGPGAIDELDEAGMDPIDRKARLGLEQHRNAMQHKDE
jgi:hypothetical protein